MYAPCAAKRATRSATGFGCVSIRLRWLRATPWRRCGSGGRRSGENPRIPSGLTASSHIRATSGPSPPPRPSPSASMDMRDTRRLMRMMGPLSAPPFVGGSSAMVHAPPAYSLNCDARVLPCSRGAQTGRRAGRCNAPSLPHSRKHHKPRNTPYSHSPDNSRIQPPRRTWRRIAPTWSAHTTGLLGRPSPRGGPTAASCVRRSATRVGGGARRCERSGPT